jgi:2'-5' RNA ligase
VAHHRLFVAIRPPLDIRRRLLAVMGGVPGARWQEDEQLHCTLRFIGEVDRHGAEDVAAVLGRVRHERMTLRLDGYGSFARGARIDTLWAALSPREEARVLHEKINRALAAIGLEPETRAYVPHITLARFGRAGAPGPSVVQSLPAIEPASFEADAFLLYESHLGSTGAAYEAIARYPLG